MEIENKLKAILNKLEETSIQSSQESTNGSSTNKRNRRNSENADEEERGESELVSSFTQSPTFLNKIKLRDYQIDGLNWLISFYDRNLNGILGDEMGLGKTIQTISLLGYLKTYRSVNGPFLIIVPLSTINNWLSEINNYCPSLRPIVLYGTHELRKQVINQYFRKINEAKCSEWDVLLCSYESILIEKTKIRKINWKYVIVDEGHRIKNENAILTQFICNELISERRLLLTGTPIQNDLMELWSLLNFLLPDLFNQPDIKEIFEDSNIENVGCLSLLRQILKNLMLARVKADVEKSVPPKTELIIYAKLTKLQRDLYKSLLLKDIKIFDDNGNSSSFYTKLLNILMQVRKCSNHPFLFPGCESGPPYITDENIVNVSGKMQILDQLLNNLRSNGHRCLLFSQFVIMLDVIEDYLIWKKIKYLRFDGRTDQSERFKMIKEFNTKPKDYFIFILSTRAGGLGINLATADTVIIYDSDWNPHVDKQAIDRVHRIGQTKPVTVYRLVTENSIDERMLNVAQSKLYLDHQLTSDEFDSELVRGLQKNTVLSILNEDLDYLVKSEQQEQEEQQQQTQKIDMNKILKYSKERHKLKQQQFNNDYYTSISSNDSNKNIKSIKENLNKMEIMRRRGDVGVSNYFEFEGRNYRLLKTHSYGKKWQGREQLVIDNDVQRTSRPLKQFEVEKFKFYPKRLEQLLEREAYAYKRSIGYKPVIDMSLQPEIAMRLYNQEVFKIENLKELSKEEQLEKDSLMNEGFNDWTKSEYNLFLKGNQLFGRTDFASIQSIVETKTIDEIQKYSKVFWQRYKELKNGAQLVRRIEMREEKLKRKNFLKELLKNKIEIEADMNFYDININYSLDHRNLMNSPFSLEEDRFLIYKFYLLNGLDYDNYDSRSYICIYKQIKSDIKIDKRFLFNFHFKSLDEHQIKERIRLILKLFEMEYYENLNKQNIGTDDLDYNNMQMQIGCNSNDDNCVIISDDSESDNNEVMEYDSDHNEVKLQDN